MVDYSPSISLKTGVRHVALIKNSQTFGTGEDTSKSLRSFLLGWDECRCPFLFETVYRLC